jgi:hypothetical protein
MSAVPPEDWEWQMIDLSLQLANARWEIETMKKSRSWRFTAPFRAVYTFGHQLIQALEVQGQDGPRHRFTPTRTDRLKKPPAKARHRSHRPAKGPSS